MRLQKVLAAAGIASRRASEELIAAGRVTVDGQRVDRMGFRVDPARAEVRVDGRLVVTRDDLVYVAVHKPRGMLSAMSDERGRPTVAELVADRPERLFHVGRLDADSEGLLLMTSDGELAHRLMHPSHGVTKTYLAEVEGQVARSLAGRLRKGVELDDGPVQVDAFRIVSTGGTHSSGGRSMVEIVLHEGRNHIVRRLLAAQGHPVTRLVRTAIGPVGLGSLPAGQTRDLSTDEISALHS